MGWSEENFLCDRLVTTMILHAHLIVLPVPLSTRLQWAMETFCEKPLLHNIAILSVCGVLLCSPEMAASAHFLLVGGALPASPQLVSTHHGETFTCHYKLNEASAHETFVNGLLN